MHRSALGAICIDIPDADFPGASAFWQAAFARPARVGRTNPEFMVLEGSFGGIAGLLQRVGDPASRVHLDLHTDDVEAEVRRLCSLGASEVARRGGWVVLADPAGMLLCVVPVAADDPVLEGAPSFED